MVSLVWFILSLCYLCEFSWWPVFIEGIIVFIASTISYSVSNNTNTSVGLLSVFDIGVFTFAAMKLFCGLTISPWWMLISFLILFIAILFPGGLSLTYLLFYHLNIITFSKGELIFLIVVDALIFIAMIWGIIEKIVSSKKEESLK